MRISSISKNQFLYISSAAIYAASFLCVDYCWWFSFFCFVPLFLCSFHSYKQAATAGFLWGVIAYGSTLSALFDLIVLLGSGWQKLLCALFFLGYFACFTAFWFCLAKGISNLTRSWFLGWSSATAFYFQCVVSLFFYPITGSVQGYGIACPLVPLQTCSVFLVALPLCGWFFTRAFLLIFQAGVAFKKKRVILLGAIPFLWGIFYSSHPTNEKKDFDTKVVLISADFKEKYPSERMFEIAYLLDQAVHKNPQGKLFVLPESAFPFALQQFPQALALWSEKIQNNYLIIGSHYQTTQHKKNLYNSAFLIHKGRIIGRYDKKHLLPFFETSCKKNKLFKKTHTYFMKNKELFSARCSEHDSWNIEGHQVKVRICSELLWDMPKKSTLIVLVHDGYYRFSYYSKLFLLFAQFQASLKQSNLFYCSWKRAYNGCLTNCI